MDSLGQLECRHSLLEDNKNDRTSKRIGSQSSIKTEKSRELLTMKNAEYYTH